MGSGTSPHGPGCPLLGPGDAGMRCTSGNHRRGLGLESDELTDIGP